MILERLTLTNFRNYSKKTIKFGMVNLISAPNGSGKSNLIEAIGLLSTGASERAGKIEEMIKWGCEVASVTAVVRDEKESYTELSVVLTHGVVAGKRSPKRRYLVDGVARTRAFFVGKLTTVSFAPQDMRLIEGSKERRRRHIDSILSQAHPDYERALSTYEAALKRRNKILDFIREGKAKISELAYWDMSLVKNSDIITKYRRDYLDYLSTQVKVAYGEYRVQYLPSTLSPERLKEHIQAEIALGYTLVGPHKDDFVVVMYTNKQMTNVHKLHDEVNLHIYGSRGEQRLGVLFLKMGSLKYLESVLTVKPVILLDDIFSELDETNRERVLTLRDEYQLITTTAEEKLGIEIRGLQMVKLS